MTTQITLPRDAAGREIPLDTKVLYDKDNKEHRVLNYIFNTDTGNWIADFETEITSELHATEGFSLMPLDSWEKLFEDLDRAAENKDAFFSIECAYINQAGYMCDNCKFHSSLVKDCLGQMVEDIASRIRNLRGEDDA